MSAPTYEQRLDAAQGAHELAMSILALFDDPHGGTGHAVRAAGMLDLYAYLTQVEAQAYRVLKRAEEEIEDVRLEKIADLGARTEVSP